MDAQLHLLTVDSTPTEHRDARSPARRQDVGRPAWRLDDDARTVGLAGIARAREVLRAARRAHHDEASAA
ncbi:MAG: hypothetical protein U0Q07_15815 [Acidimicrobiales bacterium]